ncbi:MAG: hypothetical protein A2W90_19325 [Bacteroidetes bacterium GWF2_42_66]|nr:MAG: hypothetical protein A2W92_18155 [Bacteroidetes bacterium GWA2_42_15]OFX98681.1 MAG: hypothetical protein A2W89_10370 [Bacteroidetes bacterium GWE2_42_39]OFY43121.1 MAG: hypothetical protein A2W90_19325 [Bacteroidetes bacterium GWF2_42_66]HBL77032.1 hypothetical protein [Prolixibacteraceae bacterium]HCR90125.1 hypothetical protein [Prolixibacteraceae bacterium]
MAFEKSVINFSNHVYKSRSFSISLFKIRPFRPAIVVPMAKVNPCFEGVQVQASGFAENLHPPSSNSIFCKKPALPNTTFLSHQNNNDRPDGKTHNVK